VKESKIGWVNNPQNISLDHSCQLTPDFISIFEMIQPKTGANRRLNKIEWLKPLCHSVAVTVSTK
jgi:hypothetical protein